VYGDGVNHRACAATWLVSVKGWLPLCLTFIALGSLAGCGELFPAAEPAGCLALSEPLGSQAVDVPGRVLTKPDDAIAFIYDQTQLRTFELRLEDRDLAFLDADPVAEQYVPGTLVFEGQEYGPVGIRYKGSVGSFLGCTAESEGLQSSGPKVCPKLSLKVSFNKFEPEGRFFGVKKLLFHAMVQDDSMMRERLGYWLFEEMGVPAPRAVHTRLLINGVYAGVFLNVEYIDGRFTRSRFEDGEGNLYKEVWPTRFGQQGPMSAEEILEGLRTNEDESPSVEKMIRFGTELTSASGDMRAEAVQSWLNVQHTMNYIAVDRTIRADDGPFHFYCIFGECSNHNVYLYEEAKTDRMYLIPWDLDNAFVIDGDNRTGTDAFLFVEDAWNDATVPCESGTGFRFFTLSQMPPSCDPFLNALGCYFTPGYESAVRTFLDGPFSAATVEAQLTAWEEQIAAAVDEQFATNPEHPSPTAWKAATQNLRFRIERLRTQAEALVP
jgi:hypothetical protein